MEQPIVIHVHYWEGCAALRRAHPTDAGVDIAALGDYTMEPHERIKIETGVALAIPHGYYCQIAPKSGLAARLGLDVLAGVVDCDYRNTIQVVLINHSSTVVEIKNRQYIAQLLFLPVPTVEFIERATLEETDRGLRGFGS